MWKVRIFSAFAVLSLFTASAVALALGGRPSNGKLIHAEKHIEQATLTQYAELQPLDIELVDTDYGYIVKSNGGIVGVYTSDGGTLIELLPIEPDGLRAADAQQLERGITVADDSELAQLVEDFSS